MSFTTTKCLFPLMHYYVFYLYLYYIATRCLFVCVLLAYLLRNGLTDLANSFLLAPFWLGVGIRPKNSGYRTDFPEIRKNQFSLHFYFYTLNILLAKIFEFTP